MVGATVPQPTEPSADDARELGAQLLVFLRRALLPIRSALRTALADIYAHLDSRCTDYTPAAYAPYQPRPYDPMGSSPRTLPNLLTALTAFDSRKISNGSANNDGIPDGMSLAHLICTSLVTKVVDDNKDWMPTRANFIDLLLSAFPSATEITLAAESMTENIVCTAGSTRAFALHILGTTARLWDLDRLTGLTAFTAPNLKYLYGRASGRHNNTMIRGNMENVEFPELLAFYTQQQGGYAAGLVNDLPNCKAFRAPKMETWTGQDARYPVIGNCPNLEVVDFGSLPAPNFGDGSYATPFNNCPKLIDLIFKEWTASRNLSGWNPTDKGTTFLQNFKEHIALRLTDQGSGKTLTLSQAVFDTIWNQDGTPKSTDPDSVIYQINKIIKTDKHWSVNRA